MVVFVCFRLRYDNKGLVQSCGFASAEDATSADLKLWMPRVTDEAMAIDTAKYIVKHVGSGFCEMIEQEKSAMSWLKPNGMLAISHWSVWLYFFFFPSVLRWSVAVSTICRHSSRVVAFLQAVVRPKFRGPRSASIAVVTAVLLFL